MGLTTKDTKNTKFLKIRNILVFFVSLVVQLGITTKDTKDTKFFKTKNILMFFVSLVVHFLSSSIRYALTACGKGLGAAGVAVRTWRWKASYMSRAQMAAL